MGQLPRKILSYEDLRRTAASFFAQYHLSGTIPVPIEHIAEQELDLHIVPVPGLAQAQRIHDRGIVEFITGDLREIHVDEYIWRHRHSRYRFTIAHEIGHRVLHRRLYERRSFRSVQEWKAFINSIPPEEHGWYEWQAYAFAGLVLVPSEPLRESLGRHFREVSDRVAQEGIRLAAVYDRVWDMVLDTVGKEFEVSTQVIQKRVDKDRLQDEFRVP
ncbi:MAG: ImmA/IrrE family metallo-endopeptidase [Candidatus Brocadiia bacterium]